MRPFVVALSFVKGGPEEANTHLVWTNHENFTYHSYLGKMRSFKSQREGRGQERVVLTDGPVGSSSLFCRVRASGMTVDVV